MEADIQILNGIYYIPISYMQKTISYLKYRHRQRELNLKVIGTTFSFNRDLFPLCKIMFTTCNNEKHILFLTNFHILFYLLTVRPRDTRPQAARTSTMHVFEKGPKNLEMHAFVKLLLKMHVF